MSERSEALRDAAKRAKWYQTGEEALLIAAADAIERHEREIAHAVALERESVAAWLESDALALEANDGACATDADAATAIRECAQAIREGAHHAHVHGNGARTAPGATNTPNVAHATPEGHSGQRAADFETEGDEQ